MPPATCCATTSIWPSGSVALATAVNLFARRLVVQQRVICASPGYLREHGTSKTLADVGGHRCVVGTLNGPPLVWFVREGNAETKFTPTATHQLSDGEAMLDMAVAGLGIVELPLSLVREKLQSGMLEEVLPECAGQGVEVHAVWTHRGRFSPRLRYVVDRLEDFAARGRLD